MPCSGRQRPAANACAVLPRMSMAHLLLLQQVLQDCLPAEQVALGCAHRVLTGRRAAGQQGTERSEQRQRPRERVPVQTATKIAVRMHLQQLNTCRMHCSGSTAGQTDGQQVCSAAAVRQGSAAGTAAHHSRHQREPAVVIVADRVLHDKTHPRAGVTFRTGNPQQPWSLSRSVSCRVCSSLAVPLCCPPAHLAEPLGGCAIPQRLLLMVSEGLGAHHSRILAVLAPHPATEACKRRLLATGGSGGGGAASRPALERRRRRTDSLTWLSPLKLLHNRSSPPEQQRRQASRLLPPGGVGGLARGCKDVRRSCAACSQWAGRFGEVANKCAEMQEASGNAGSLWG